MSLRRLKHSTDWKKFDTCEGTSDTENAENVWSDKEIENWSDWKIIVSCKKEDDSSSDPITYYVHKGQLAHGKYHSEYFRRLFNQENTKGDTESYSTLESANATSNIVFENPSSVEAFPVFLNFLYSDNKKKYFTSKNVIALRYLSNYFVVEQLYHDVNEFIHADVTTNNSMLYFLEAFKYQDDKLLGVVSKHVAYYLGKEIDINEVLDLPTEFLMSDAATDMIVKLAENFSKVEKARIVSMPAELLKKVICCKDFNRIEIVFYPSWNRLDSH